MKILETIMRQATVFFIVFLLLLAAPFQADAGVYKWVDDEGTVNFADDYYSVPAKYRARAEVVATVAPPATVNLNEISVPFERTPSGILLVEVILNGSIRAKMVFDTGANVVVISKKLSGKIGQPFSPSDAVRMRTAGGEVEGRYLIIPRMELGMASKENVRAVMTTQSNVFKDFDGLLGMSFLEGYHVVIDNPGSRLILRR
jgi:clan AA aspartic protease (TIGR02281 family)